MTTILLIYLTHIDFRIYGECWGYSDFICLGKGRFQTSECINTTINSTLLGLLLLLYKNYTKRTKLKKNCRRKQSKGRKRVFLSSSSVATSEKKRKKLNNWLLLLLLQYWVLTFLKFDLILCMYVSIDRSIHVKKINNLKICTSKIFFWWRVWVGVSVLHIIVKSKHTLNTLF